jgi:hypothetical protein
MIEPDQPLGFHSPRGEWGVWVEIDQPLCCHSLMGEWGQPRMKMDRLLGLHSFDEE